MKSRSLFSLLFLVAFLLSACSGGYRTSSWSGVTVDGQVAYLAGGGQVFAINTSNGAELWRYPEKANASIQFYAAPVLTHDGQLIVGDYGHTLYSLNPETGAENWRFEESAYGYVASPLVTDDAIYAPTNGGFVFALGLNGQLRWSKSLDGESSVWVQPEIDADGDYIYVASMDHHVYALNIADGQLLWVSDSMGGSIIGKPVLNDGVLYVGTLASQMVALNKDNGQTAFPAYNTDDAVWAGPELLDGQLYFCDHSGTFYILDAKDLSEVAKVPGADVVVSAPLVLADAVYVTTQGGESGSGSLLLFERDGKSGGKHTFAGQLLGPAVQAGDLILLAPFEGEALLIAVNHLGVQQWDFVPEKK